MWFLFYLCKPCFLLALQIVCSNNFMPKLVTIFCIIMNLKCMNSLYITIKSYFPGCNYKIYCSLPTWFKGSHANNAILLYSLYLIICCRLRVGDVCDETRIRLSLIGRIVGPFLSGVQTQVSYSQIVYLKNKNTLISFPV